MKFEPGPDRSDEIHAYFLRYQDTNQRPPTVRETAEALGFKSASSVYNWLHRLTVDGRMRHTPMIARGYRAIEPEG